ESAPEATVKAIEARLGLNDPLYEQYFRFLGNAVQLDFGASIRDDIPVFNHIPARFMITLELSVMAMIFSIFWGLLAGIISAVRKCTFEDVAMMVVALFGLSLPTFWFGLLVIAWLGVA